MRKTITHFSQKVGKSRKDMIAFLRGHFRYDTMNYCNASTSYASKIKVHSLPIPDGLRDAAYAMLESEEWADRMGSLMIFFALEHDYEWQMGTNGRSGGYIVLYQGEKKPDTFSKSRCPSCGIKTGYEAGKECQRCHKDKLVPYSGHTVSTFPGRSTDQGEDFEEWDSDSLRARVRLVREFDAACDGILNEFIGYCTDFEVKDKIVYVPKTVKVLVEK
jgi:hypothetical protein